MGSRVAVAGVVAVVAIVVLRVGVAPAETCPTASVADTRAAAEAAVEWFAANQHEDGSFAYLLDDDGRDLGGYSVTRHAGVLLSLYQAVSAGIDDALPVAESGLEWATAQSSTAGAGRALGGAGSQLQTGPAPSSSPRWSSAGQRRATTETTTLIADVAGFLGEAVEPSGAVPEAWDSTTERAVPDSYSVFSTGEVLWALALTGRPEAEAVAAYMPRRDDVEDRFPPTLGPLGGYAWAELAAQGTSLSDDQWTTPTGWRTSSACRCASESTRWTAEGPVTWLRQGPAVGLGRRHPRRGHGRTAAAVRQHHRRDGVDAGPDGLAERAPCVAGMLVGARRTARSRPAGRVVRRRGDPDGRPAARAVGAARRRAGARGRGRRRGRTGRRGRGPVGAPRRRHRPVGGSEPGAPHGPTGPARLAVAGTYAAVVVLAALSGPMADSPLAQPGERAPGRGHVLLVVSAAELVTPAGDWIDGLALAATVVVTLAAGVDNGILLVVPGAIPAAAPPSGCPTRGGGRSRPGCRGVGAAVAISLVVDGVLGV